MRSFFLLSTACGVFIASPSVAQDHLNHGQAAPNVQPAAQSECEKEAASHRAMGHSVSADYCDAKDAQPDPSVSTEVRPMDGHSMPTECEKEAERHRAMGHSVPAGECGPMMIEEPASMPRMDQSSPSGHMDHSMDAPAAADCEAEADRHRAMGYPVPAGQCAPPGESVDMSGHSPGHQMSGAMIPMAPPPASAGSGPPRAADAIWGAEAMRGSRELLRMEQGGQKYSWFQGDRVEYRARDNADGYLFDLQGYYGGDLNKFWFKSEGEGSFGEEIESVEVQALYSRAIAPFFDLQAGIRQDFAPMDRTYAVVGIQGLAPYLFEVDAAAFLSDRGDLTARVEAELDQRVTQRLVLQPRAEVSFSAQDVPELGIGAGIDTIEAGLRLRYHFAREFAPYIGIDQEWKIGQSADYARAEGEDPSVTNYVIGVRFWF
jgi:copper resistance protein B